MSRTIAELQHAIQLPFRALSITRLEVWQIGIDLRDGTHTRAIVPVRLAPHIR